MELLSESWRIDKGIGHGETEDKQTLERLEEVCEEKGIKIFICRIPSEYFIYHEDERKVILDVSAQAKHVKLLIDFITY